MWRHSRGRNAAGAADLHQAAAQRVGHRDVARAHRLHQARHAQQGVAAQLQRIAKVVVQAAQDHVHRLQAAQHLEEDAVVAHRQVAALDQRVSPGSGPGRRARNRSRCRGRASAGRCAGCRGCAAPAPRSVSRIGAEEQRQALHLAVAEDVRQHARPDQAIFQRVAGPGRRLRAIARSPTIAPSGERARSAA